MQNCLNWRVFPINWLSQWQGWSLGKMLINKQTSPLPANKELICSTLHQDRTSAVVCERCRRRKEKRQRHRLQSSFLTSAAAALALQPHCASEPGAWRDHWVLLTTSPMLWGSTRAMWAAPARSSMCPCAVSMSLFQSEPAGPWGDHPVPACTPPCLNSQGILSLQHPCGVTSLSNTRYQNFSVFLFTACHHPVISFLEWVPFLQLSRSTEILPVDVLDQKEQMSSQIIFSPDVVHAWFATNIA